jgi:hypothetical protein
MALIDCLECGTQASTEATFCPNCGFPISKVREAKPPAPVGFPAVTLSMLDVTRSIVVRLLLGAFMVWTGVEFDAPPAIALAMVPWASVVVLYLKARKAHKLGPLAGHRELEEAVRKQLTAARDETERQLASAEQNTGRIAELEERIDFMERLVARQRERS